MEDEAGGTGRLILCGEAEGGGVGAEELEAADGHIAAAGIGEGDGFWGDGGGAGEGKRGGAGRGRGGAVFLQGKLRRGDRGDAVVVVGGDDELIGGGDTGVVIEVGVGVIAGLSDCLVEAAYDDLEITGVNDAVAVGVAGELDEVLGEGGDEVAGGIERGVGEEFNGIGAVGEGEGGEIERGGVSGKGKVGLGERYWSGAGEELEIASGKGGAQVLGEGKGDGGNEAAPLVAGVDDGGE